MTNANIVSSEHLQFAAVVSCALDDLWRKDNGPWLRELPWRLTSSVGGVPRRERLRATPALSKADEKWLVRARLVELGVAGDGLVQSRAEELAVRIARDLQSRGSVDEARINDAISHADVAELVGNLGEAPARRRLADLVLDLHRRE